MEIPGIGIGTWQVEPEKCYQIVKDALDLGYMHVDTAQRYDNEEGVGRAIEESSVERENIFLTTKVWMDNYKYDDVISSVNESLRKLRTDYVDLLLMHWPSKDHDHHETLDAMMHLKRQGKVRKIGVSNFTLAQTEDAVDYTGGEIYTNQIEHHVYLGQDKIQDFCEKHDVIVTAYSPLAHGHILKDKVLQEIGEKHGKTVGQIALKWLRQVCGDVVIPKSSSRKHLEENLTLDDFMLDDEDIQRIQQLPKSYRYINPPFAPEWDN